MNQKQSEKAKPVAELRLGRIKATIWKNETEKMGARYNTTYSRIYRVEPENKADSGWRESTTFGRDDHLLLAKLADRVHSWILAPGTDAEE